MSEDEKVASPTSSVLVPVGSASKGFRLDIAGIPIPLKRTFGALDRLIATPIEALADSLERKLKANIDSHVEAVRKKRRKRGKTETISDPSVKMTKALGEWATSASEIDPEEQELSALWRSVLDEILEGREDADDLLRAVKALANSDILFFIRVYTKARLLQLPVIAFGKYDVILNRLRAHGLVARTVSTLLLVWFAVTLAFFFFGAVTVTGVRLGEFGVMATGLTLAISIILVSNVHRPTILGRKLCRLYKIYAQGDEKKK